jgi:hypothetical protein
MRSKPGCAFSRRYPALYLVRAIFVRLGDLAMLTSVLRISLWVLTPKWPCSCRPTSRSRYLRESASAPDPQPKTLARGHAHSGGSENRTRTRQKQQSGTSIKWNRLLPCEPEIRKPHSCLPTRPSKRPGLGEDGAVGTAAMAPQRKRQCRFPGPAFGSVLDLRSRLLPLSGAGDGLSPIYSTRRRQLCTDCDCWCRLASGRRSPTSSELAQNRAKRGNIATALAFERANFPVGGDGHAGLTITYVATSGLTFQGPLPPPCSADRSSRDPVSSPRVSFDMGTEGRWHSATGPFCVVCPSSRIADARAWALPAVATAPLAVRFGL